MSDKARTTEQTLAGEIEQLTRYWTTFEDGFHGLDPAPPGKGDWLKRSDVMDLLRSLSDVERPQEQTARRYHFVCPECGPNVAVDEDGCCRMCGGDAHPVTDTPPPVSASPQTKDDHGAGLIGQPSAIAVSWRGRHE